MNFAILITASIICIIWGIGHIVPTQNIVRLFGGLTIENRRILVMEWISEGLTLAFVGVMIEAMALWGGGGDTSRLVLRLSAGMLLVMAALSLFTGARTSILPMRLCPAVKTIAALLVIIATLNTAE